MTDRLAQPPVGAGRVPGPEVVAGLLVVVLLGAIGTGLVLGGAASPPDGPAASASPSISAQPTTPPAVDPATVDLLGVLNDRLVLAGEELAGELDQDPFEPAEVAPLIRQVNATVQFGVDAVPSLGGQTGEDQVGGRLAALYRELEETATATLRASVQNEVEYRTGAGAIVALIEGLPPLQEELEALAREPAPSALPSVSPSAGASVSPTPTSAPTAVPTPTPTAAPTPPRPSAGPTASPVVGEQLEDGGFEAGVGPPWEFRVATGAVATIAADALAPGAGAASARIDIAVQSTAYSGVSLRQPGLDLQAGARYALSVAVRSQSVRELRLRITSPAGASYLTRIATAGPAWSTVTFDFVAPVTDPDAAIEIELGRSTVTTWLDAVSFAPFAVPPSP